MRLFLRKALIWNLAIVLLLPTWIMAGFFSANQAKAAEETAGLGDVNLTQFMVYPTKTATAQDGVWIEFYNKSAKNFDLANWHIGIDASAVPLAGSCIAVSKRYVTIGTNADIGSNGGINLNCSANISLSKVSGSHTVELFDKNNTVIDSVNYLGSDIVDGRSRYYDGVNWANESVYTYGAGDFGKPANNAAELTLSHKSYPRIQMAIDAATAGDNITVFSGNHNEDLTIAKQITITGMNNPSVTSITLNSGANLNGSSNITTSVANVNAGARLGDAIDLISTGGLINLGSGSYDGGINITKSLTLAGAAGAVINASGSAKTISVSGIGPRVVLRSLAIKGNASGTGLSLESGSVTLSDSSIQDFATAIAITGGTSHRINNNSLTGSPVAVANSGLPGAAAANNWWGTADKAAIQAKLTGTAAVVFEPYYIDAVKTVLSNVVPAVVFVNPAYSDGNTGGYIFGYNAFGKIQDGVSVVKVGGTVNVSAGLFDEAVVINRDMAVSGAGLDTVVKNSLTSGSTITVDGGNVNISGLKLTGSATAVKVNGGNLSISQSGIVGNSLAGINASSAATVTAAMNYWGSLSGPTATANPLGNGDKIVGDNVVFRPFYTDPAKTQLSSMISDAGTLPNLFQVGTLAADGNDRAATPGVTVNEQLQINIPTGGGVSSVQLPQSTRITRSDGLNFDAASISGLASQASLVSGLPDNLVAAGLLQWGISGVEVTFNPAITINLYVGEGSNGKLLSVLRSVNGSSWTNAGIVSPGTCLVTGGLCSFQTNKASYFATVAGLVAPTITATAVKDNSERIIKVEWNGSGGAVEKYQIFVNGVGSDLTTIPVLGNDFGKVYSQRIKVSADGKYEIYIRVYSGSVYVSSAPVVVDFAQAAAQAVVSTPKESKPEVTAGPAKAEAKAPVANAEEPKAEEPKSEPNPDENGVIKGDEEKTAEEKINWTPWIVLFVLIILTGAATGAYFYWFSGEEELESAVAPVRAEIETKAISSRKTESKKASGRKKAKRW